jgi:hypothetical protein
MTAPEIINTSMFVCMAGIFIALYRDNKASNKTVLEKVAEISKWIGGLDEFKENVKGDIAEIKQGCIRRHNGNGSVKRIAKPSNGGKYEHKREIQRTV